MEQQTEQPKAVPQEQFYGYQRRGIMDILFNLETVLFFSLIFLLILWIGIIFGLAGGSLYYQIGRILYSLGGIFLFFFTLGTSIMNNNLHVSLRVSLIVLSIALLLITMTFP
jgi:hypothetical protein